MNTHLNLAYNIGATAAKQDFSKIAAGEIMTPAFGAIPGLAGPALAGIAGGTTAPEGKGLSIGARAAGGSLLGQVLGGPGGAALGAGAGYGIGRLINALGGNTDPQIAALIGSLVGGIGGTMSGGAYGAHAGRKMGLGQSSNK